MNNIPDTVHDKITDNFPQGAKAITLLELSYEELRTLNELVQADLNKEEESLIYDIGGGKLADILKAKISLIWKGRTIS